MVSFTFSVDDEPPHSGLSLGHLDVIGRDGTASTRGGTSDQRLMVYLSAAQLLWDVQVLLDAGHGTRAFVGADSSFTLTFTHRHSTIDISHEDRRIDSSPVAEFADAALASAKALYDNGSAEVVEHHNALEDLRNAIEKSEARRPR